MGILLGKISGDASLLSPEFCNYDEVHSLQRQDRQYSTEHSTITSQYTIQNVCFGRK